MRTAMQKKQDEACSVDGVPLILTRSLQERLRPICLQSYENLLETEQVNVAWKNG